MKAQLRNRHLLVIGFCATSLLIGGCASQQITSLGMLGTDTESSAKESTESSSKTLYLTIVEGLLDQGRYRAALGYLNQYAVSESADPRFNLLRGEALLGVQQYDEARAAFSALSGTDMEGAGYSGIGRVNAAKGDWKAAEVAFSKSVAAQPSNSEYLNNLGYAELELGGPAALSQALFSLRQAQELDPSSPSIRNNLVLALTLSGKNDEAQRLIQSISTPSERLAVQKFAANWTSVKNNEVIE